MNYFEIFDIKISYSIDINLLEDRYFKRQKDFHPDRYASKSDDEKLDAMQKSMEANKAYETLKSDLLRAEYLITEQGIPLCKESEAAKRISSESLMEAFEDRQMLESANSKNRLNELLSTAENALALYKTEFKNLYQKKLFDDAAVSVLKMRYKNKFIEEVKVKCSY